MARGESFFNSLLTPKIIEVIPVVRGIAAVVFQAFDITVQRLFEKNAARRARRRPRLDEAFEINIVTIAATIQTEHQHHRPFQHGSEAKRTAWKAGLRA